MHTNICMLHSHNIVSWSLLVCLQYQQAHMNYEIIKMHKAGLTVFSSPFLVEMYTNSENLPNNRISNSAKYLAITICEYEAEYE